MRILLICNFILGAVLLLSIVRYFCLRSNVRSITKQLADLDHYPDMNLNLKSVCKDADAIKLITRMNEHLRLDQQLRLSYDQREEKLKQEIANISHDLRTPLTSVLGYLKLLKDGGLNGEDLEYALIVEKKAKIMKELVAQFYELSSMDALDYPVHKKKVYVYNLMSESILAFYQDFEQKGLQVQLELSPQVPEIYLDEQIFLRTMTNLIQNALRYAVSYVKIQLSVRKEAEKELVVIRFENDDASLNQESVTHIFERSYTADSSRANGQSGLGLAIVKKQVQLQGGRVKAEIEDKKFALELTFES